MPGVPCVPLKGDRVGVVRFRYRRRVVVRAFKRVDLLLQRLNLFILLLNALVQLLNSIISHLHILGIPGEDIVQFINCEMTRYGWAECQGNYEADDNTRNVILPVVLLAHVSFCHCCSFLLCSGFAQIKLQSPFSLLLDCITIYIIA